MCLVFTFFWLMAVVFDSSPSPVTYPKAQRTALTSSHEWSASVVLWQFMTTVGCLCRAATLKCYLHLSTFYSSDIQLIICSCVPMANVVCYSKDCYHHLFLKVLDQGLSLHSKNKKKLRAFIYQVFFLALIGIATLSISDKKWWTGLCRTHK